MRRRDFIAGLGSAAAWPVVARAQQGERVRRIGVLISFAADAAEGAFREVLFYRALQDLGWNDGRNVRIDYRWGAGNDERIRAYAAELVALAPDVIMSSGGQALRSLLAASRNVPILFTQVLDPVGQGLVASLARPGGNATGFTPFEYGMSAKWLQVLKQIAPHVVRVAVLRDPLLPGGIGQWSAVQTVASSFGVELRPVNIRDPIEIDRGISELARELNGGVIVTSGALAAVHRDLIIKLASSRRLPAVYPLRSYVVSGGLIFYGPESTDQYRLAATYVDRILRGEKPADLPVQAPSKYELVINLKTAKALGLTIPETLLATADEVIQ